MALSVVLKAAALFLALAAPAAALTATIEPLAEFKHVSWPMEASAPSRINTIGQGQDGYLWIGGVDGLFRFDGVIFEPVHLENGPPGHLVVSEVLGARSGEVWVGLARSQGVAVYRHGRLVNAAMPHPSREVTGLAEDREGGVWVARGGRKRQTLARYWKGHWQEIGADWSLPEQEIWQILFTPDGAMWVVLSNTVMRLPPGGKRFEPTGARTSRRAGIAVDRAGRIWLADATGTRLLSARPEASIAPVYAHRDEIGGTRILIDRRGDLWGATWTDGLFQIPAIASADKGNAGRPVQVRSYKAVNGLTSDQSRSVFQDREDNIWFGTELGLDMLRPASVVVEPGIASNSARGYRMAATADGAVHIADSHTLYTIEPGKPPRPVLNTTWSPGALCASGSDGVWMTLRDTMLQVRNRRVQTFPKPAETSAYGCAEDQAGRLWMPALDKGLYVFQSSAWRRWQDHSGATDPASNAALDAQGGAIIQFRGEPSLTSSSPFTAVYKSRFKIGEIEGLLPGREALFVSGGQGMARLQGSRTTTLDARTYPWLGSVNGLVQTRAGDTWTIGDAGIIRMRTDDLARAFDQPGQALPHRVYDFHDGLNSFVQKLPGPQIAEGGDGRLWILTRRNVVVIDPARLETNPTPPPVSIRSVLAGGRRFRDPTSIVLPTGTTDLRVSYTALSLSVPSRVRFQYRLEGIDKGWIDAGGRREAFYGDLRPGTFRFQVKAANNDGVWNNQGATLIVRIPPTLIQTWWFRLTALLIFALAFWGGYALRLKRVSARIQSRLEERVAERERIARELHDTLLQSVQGLIMRFQSVADQIPDDQPAKVSINTALDRADQMLVEGRDRVHDLRNRDSRRLDVILRELMREQPFDSAAQLDLACDGAPRAIQPLIAEEIVRIAGEALFNAAKHARASQILVRVSYGAKRLQVIMQDNGVGIAANPQAWTGREGHYGLIGMQERARKMGAQLSIESAPGTGTRVILAVRAAVAYQAKSWTWPFGKASSADL